MVSSHELRHRERDLTTFKKNPHTTIPPRSAGTMARESFSSITGPVWVDRLDSNDWIAPCVDDQPPSDHDDHVDKKPSHPPHTHPEPFAHRRRISSVSETSDVRDLWECMLELQQRYGCYRSARMEAAISVFDGADLMRGLSPRTTSRLKPHH
jgi:hypothetical protein